MTAWERVGAAPATTLPAAAPPLACFSQSGPSAVYPIGRPAAAGPVPAKKLRTRAPVATMPEMEVRLMFMVIPFVRWPAGCPADGNHLPERCFAPGL